jgi:hypothetical protein
MKLSMKQVLLLIAVLTVIAAPVLAQTSAPATTVAVAGDPRMALPDAPAPSTNRPPSVAAVGRPTFGGEQVIDREFVIGNSVMLGSTIANIELTARCMESGACSAVPNHLKNRERLYVVGLPANLGVGVLGYYLKRGGHRWWFVPAALITTGNVVYGIHAAKYIR